MQLRLSDVPQAAVLTLDLFAKTLELSAANIFEVRALRELGGRFIKIDGDAIALPDFLAYPSRQRHAILQRYSFDRDEWHHVRRAAVPLHDSVPRQLHP